MEGKSGGWKDEGGWKERRTDGKTKEEDRRKDGREAKRCNDGIPQRTTELHASPDPDPTSTRSDGGTPSPRRGTHYQQHHGIQSHPLDLWHRVRSKGFQVRLGVEAETNPWSRPTGAALPLLCAGAADPELLQALQFALRVVTHLLHLPWGGEMGNVGGKKRGGERMEG